MSNTISFGKFLGMSLIFWLAMTLIFLVVYIFLNWLFYYKIFKKMGYKDWECFIPYYNTYCLYKGIHNPIFLFWIFLTISLICNVFNVNQISQELLSILIVTNAVISIYTSVNTAKAFNQSIEMTILTVICPFIGLPIIGFGSSQYHYEKGNNK